MGIENTSKFEVNSLGQEGGGGQHAMLLLVMTMKMVTGDITNDSNK